MSETKNLSASSRDFIIGILLCIVNKDLYFIFAMLFCIYFCFKNNFIKTIVLIYGIVLLSYNVYINNYINKAINTYNISYINEYINKFNYGFKDKLAKSWPRIFKS